MPAQIDATGIHMRNLREKIRGRQNVVDFS